MTQGVTQGVTQNEPERDDSGKPSQDNGLGCVTIAKDCTQVSGHSQTEQRDDSGKSNRDNGLDSVTQASLCHEGLDLELDLQIQDQDQDQDQNPSRAHAREAQVSGRSRKRGVRPDVLQLAPWLANEQGISELWNEFREMRSRMRNAPFTPRAEELALRKLKGIVGATGQSPTALIEQTIERGWRTFFPIKGDQDATRRQPSEERGGAGDRVRERRAQRR